MEKCVYCGKHVPGGTLFCPHCAKELKRAFVVFLVLSGFLLAFLFAYQIIDTGEPTDQTVVSHPIYLFLETADVEPGPAISPTAAPKGIVMTPITPQ